VLCVFKRQREPVVVNLHQFTFSQFWVMFQNEFGFQLCQKLNLMKYSKDLIILPSFGTEEHQKKVPVTKSNTRLNDLSFCFCCRDIKYLLSSNALLNGDRFLNLPCNLNAVLSHPSTYRSLLHARASSALSYVMTWRVHERAWPLRTSPPLSLSLSCARALYARY